MKGVKPPDYVREFVPKKEQNTWYVRFYSEIMGIGPVGASLSKGSLPNIGLEADNEAECVLLCKQWTAWYEKEWASRKKASTRTSSRRRKAR